MPQTAEPISTKVQGQEPADNWPCGQLPVIEFAAPWPAFLEVSTPGPSPNPSLNPSLNLSLSLSSIQFILFNF